jgi:hypothetical protein
MRPLRLLFALAIAAALPAAAPAITFGSWITSYGLSGGNATISADPDGDGIPNLMEYALDGCNPTLAVDATRLPVFGWAQRTAAALGSWTWVPGTNQPPTGGVGGIYHAGLRFSPRPAVEGISYTVQLSHELSRWYSGRSAIMTQAYPGNIVQATCIAQANNRQRLFMRLQVSVDAAATDVLTGLGATGLGDEALLVGLPVAAPRVVASGSTETVTVLDRVTLRTTAATTVSDYTWSWTPAATNLSAATVERLTSNPAVIVPDPDNIYRWIYVSDGTAAITLRTGAVTYTATVTTSTATPVLVDTPQGYASASLSAHILSQVDPLLVGKTPAAALPLFSTQDHTTPTYVRNTGAWCAPYAAALTAISPWNSQGGGGMAGILISPRHVLFCTHWRPSGGTIRFIAADNTVITRTLTAVSSLPGYSGYYPDLSVGVLDSDVPGTIAFARVLPDNWAAKLPTVNSTSLRLPALGLDQEEKATVRDLSTLTAGSGSYGAVAAFAPPSNGTRAGFYEDVVLYDSGNPACLFINGQLVVLTCWTFGGSGQGTFTTYHRTAINALMTSLGGGYQLTDADLTGFPSY